MTKGVEESLAEPDAVPVGQAVTEIVVREWRLDEHNLIDPSIHTKLGSVLLVTK